MKLRLIQVTFANLIDQIYKPSYYEPDKNPMLRNATQCYIRLHNTVQQYLTFTQYYATLRNITKTLFYT